MFRLMNNYMREINLVVNADTKAMMDTVLRKSDLIEHFCITINFNRYIVDIKLKNYSVQEAKMHFDDFSNNIKYPYSDMTVRYNEGKLVRYRFASCKENKEGFYCDIIYS